jgi:serine/threonine protein kinase
MELAVGETLAARLDDGPLLTSQALDIAIGLAEAVVAVHQAGYLHRDIKSENVMLARDDRRVVAKLIDFGIACRLDADDGHDVAGTPNLMAPEQVARERVDERTDIWGLGVVLYEMLAGRLPFDDNFAIVSDPAHPLPDDIHPLVKAITLACLAKDPDDRPPSAEHLVDALRDVQARYLAVRGLLARAA